MSQFPREFFKSRTDSAVDRLKRAELPHGQLVGFGHDGSGHKILPDGEVALLIQHRNLPITGGANRRIRATAPLAAEAGAAITLADTELERGAHHYSS